MTNHICGCYFNDRTIARAPRVYLPQVKLDVRTTIQSLASRTILKQRFVNPSSERAINEIRYTFPLFDGVGIVDFMYTIGERTIYGLVKEKNEAKKMYEAAKSRGEQAGLLEQLPDAADVFTTSISNILPKSVIDVTITYVEELKHDAEVDGIRFTLPTKVAPRYGAYPGSILNAIKNDSGEISLTVDIDLAEGTTVKKVISPSHPIEVSLGALSTGGTDEKSSVSKASATLALGTASLATDFVLQVVANDVGITHAILESHPTLPNQRAVLVTLVPKFSLKPHKPEIIFLADRSGSMRSNIPTLISAMKYFLKSIPPGCMFNVYSFGDDCKSLWPRSQIYMQITLDQAIKHVEKFKSNLGGTETLAAIKSCLSARRKDVATELILLTDGDIWRQQEVFEYTAKETKNQEIRIFPIGIGSGVSSALIEGIARAGNGMPQMISNAEKMTSKVVRMLKVALMPHVKDYHLQIKYEDESIEQVTNKMEFLELEPQKVDISQPDAKPISLYNADEKEEQFKFNEEEEAIFKGAPKYDPPTIIQSPHKLPSLYPFHRTCVYLLMGPETYLNPTSVILKGTSPQGPLKVEVPIEIRKEPDQMIHQLAARKATQELEDGQGWVTDVRMNSADGSLISEDQPAFYEEMLRKEAVRLGVKFQVGGKFCSFVAVEANEVEIAEKRRKATQAAAADLDDWQLVGKTPEFDPNENEILAVEEDSDDSSEMGFGLFDGPNSPGQPVKPLTPSLLDRIVDQQGFDGSWPTLESIPCAEMDPKWDDVRNIIKKLASMANQEANETLIVKLVSTVLVVLYMEKKMADEVETWELVVDKARTFIEEMQLSLGQDIVDECWKLGEGLTLNEIG